MKFKTTKKNMRDSYNRIISIGYCDAQYLLNYENPTAYSAGANGWACDYYDIDNTLISTGYSPLSDRNVKHDYALIRLYNEQAMQIVHSNADYDEKKKCVRELLEAFISDVSL